MDDHSQNGGAIRNRKRAVHMKFSRLSRGLISTAGLVLLAAVPTLLLWHHLDLGDVDSFQYMRSGLNLISGKGFLDMSGRPMIFFLDRPLYPLAIGLASFMPFEVTTSARLVSLLSASGAVLAFHWLLSARYPRTIALTAAALFALNPLRVWSGQWIYSDALSLFLVR